MQAVKKESVYVGNGVRMRLKDGRLRITVPCSKRWRGSMFFVLYVGGMLILNGHWLLPGLLSRWLELVRAGQIFSATLWTSSGIIGLWLLLVGLAVYGFLWFLLGHYVLEIGAKDIRAGRSLLGIDFLSTNSATGVRRIRFSPSLNPDSHHTYPVRTSWHIPGGKLFRPGRYTLHLDYGLKLREVLRMAIEERQVRTIKRIIREHYPHLYQDSLKFETASHFNDQIMDRSYLKDQIK